jgi:hypothetical protein
MGVRTKEKATSVGGFSHFRIGVVRQGLAREASLVANRTTQQQAARQRGKDGETLA